MGIEPQSAPPGEQGAATGHGTAASEIAAVPAIHPGEHPAEELKELDMSAAALARRIRVPANRMTEILNGQRAVTADTV